MELEELVNRRTKWLKELSHQISSRRYRPQPPKMYRIPKKTGFRKIGSYSITDRVVATAMLQSIARMVEPMLHRRCFAFCPGKSTTTALTAAGNWFTQKTATRLGQSQLVTLDIKNCFEALPHRLFLPVIKTRVDAATFSLIKMFLSSGNPIGIIQGNPLSPLLCNVALSDFDRQMNQLDKNLAQWRYADDLLLGALDPQAAIRGVAFAVHHLAELGLRMHPDKLVISTAQQLSLIHI